MLISLIRRSILLPLFVHKKQLSHLSNVKDLLLGILTFMFIFSASYYQCYNLRQWNSTHNAFAFVEKSSKSLISTNAIFQIVSRVIFSTLFHHNIKINYSIVPKSYLYKIFLKKTFSAELQFFLSYLPQTFILKGLKTMNVHFQVLLNLIYNLINWILQSSSSFLFTHLKY